ncbi:tRNA (adenosine(37)-N6)-threonylcarbamoyltransferase complex dimerization subunit type 1 TsaB [Verticiella sediminum]|nr:tRNA (adenosine(37)-N6)-threonylcarbamoyltransferase complex dimerization subunit type 1 TsaB [Verticiella sediminum]
MAACILALETSTDTCGVALLRQGDAATELAVREHVGVAAHSARILPMIDELLAEAGVARTAIDAIAFGQGPGGFTGLRVACGVAQGLGFALSVPLVPITSHRAVEAQLDPAAPAVRAVLIDARMREAYVAAYRRDGAEAQQLQAPMLIAYDDVPVWVERSWPAWSGEAVSARTLVVAGDWGESAGVAAALPEGVVHAPVLRAQVAAVARLGLHDWSAGRVIAPDDAQPLYVRDKVAYTTRERAAGAGGNPRATGVS